MHVIIPDYFRLIAFKLVGMNNRFQLRKNKVCKWQIQKILVLKVSLTAIGHVTCNWPREFSVLPRRALEDYERSHMHLNAY